MTRNCLESSSSDDDSQDSDQGKEDEPSQDAVLQASCIQDSSEDQSSPAPQKQRRRKLTKKQKKIRDKWSTFGAPPSGKDVPTASSHMRRRIPKAPTSWVEPLRFDDSGPHSMAVYCCCVCLHEYAVTCEAQAQGTFIRSGPQDKVTCATCARTAHAGCLIDPATRSRCPTPDSSAVCDACHQGVTPPMPLKRMGSLVPVILQPPLLRVVAKVDTTLFGSAMYPQIEQHLQWHCPQRDLVSPPPSP